ncbi:MAG: biotin/lipoyl-containing protein, partial [Acidobacteriota bacterium]
ADAIHPGYGFLSENADFARQVGEAGIVWVGPSPEAIASMGDKLEAKKRMVEAGVPTLPSVEVEDDTDVAAAAAEIGYPVLVKASAGGGGKGMRIVESEAEIEEAVAAARREAASAFGNDTVFLERYVAVSRHVEIQLLGDEHGNVVHCFERECSIQRRHQKIIEEAPSPAISEVRRQEMGAAAVAAGQAIGYSSAGTVEFLVDATPGSEGDFYFLEVNTRLQVEHPVTEEITGLDLVREQLRVAQGEELGFEQSDLGILGHAIEARLYAEDPANDFLPQTGTLAAFEPSAAASARFDSGVESGSVVGIEFDPMLAKVIVHAPTRREAAARLARVLETTRVQGMVTNRDFLVATLRAPEFLAGDTTTDFIDRVQPTRQQELSTSERAEGALLATFAAQVDRRRAATLLPGVPSGWRNTVMPPEEVVYRTGELELVTHYRRQRDGSYAVSVRERAAGSEDDQIRGTPWQNIEGAGAPNDGAVEIAAREGEEIALVFDGRRLAGSVRHVGDRRLVHWGACSAELVLLSRFPRRGGEGVAGGLVAPMPGKILRIEVEAGASVEAGQLLLVLEAMKMEHRVVAPSDGVVAELRATVGDQVENDQLLVVLSDED